MKRFILIITLYSTLIFGGCESFLDISPDMGIGKEKVFGDYFSVRGYLDVCYRSLEDIHSHLSQGEYFPVQGIADEATFNYKFSGIRKVMNTGVWLGAEWCAEVGTNEGSVTTISGHAISNAFFCIRITNEVLEALTSMTNLTVVQRNELEGQARFFRAWYYFQIIKRWGGMPIFDQVLTPADELDIPRLTYHESTEWLISDLDKAISMLPDRWAPGDVGRADKVAAMAVKSMAALYDASPLMCPENGYEYDKDRCKLAAKYAHDVLQYIEDNKTTLPHRLIIVDNSSSGDENQNKWSDIFYTRNKLISDETLWCNNNASVRDNGTALKCLYFNARMCNKTGFQPAMYLEPTQNLVDMFEVINSGVAYDINDPNSGFTMNTCFKNRDPRLALNIMYPGGAPFGKDKKAQDIYLEMWKETPGVISKGTDYDNRTSIAAVRESMTTSYLCKKFIWVQALPAQVTTSAKRNNLNTIFIRIAQIYLDYAEAMNEAYGPESDPEAYGMTALDAINIIRNRVGMIDVNPNYTTDNTVFRDRIRNERAVELMMENHRWWDLRRWKIATDVFKKPIEGLIAKVTNTNGSKDPRKYTFQYERTKLTTEQRVFETRHYWYPIPMSYQESFTNFTQNEGW